MENMPGCSECSKPIHDDWQLAVKDGNTHCRFCDRVLMLKGDLQKNNFDLWREGRITLWQLIKNGI
jgi:hypothetical protein